MSVPLRIERIEHLPEVPVSRTRRRRYRISRPLRRLIGVCTAASFLSILGLAAFGAITLIHGIGSGGDLQLAPSGATGPLAATMGSAHRSAGYVTVSGAVTNTGGSNASSVEAVVELLDAQNRTIQVDQSMVAFASVPSGGATPFSVILHDDPQAVSYRVSFQHPDGRSLE